ncbi:hypothetical protein [Paracoccus siganidrum]|uniref:Proline utilization A proline dehydrogenase N-terminal domain-containing protein n=1 Tax=Paracoccus siganidrum TaxID=1276757 RepID=A0A419AAI0_9RHOB|nr:hypothetical protein [Paracoccus siganidrum]RJL19949.1 hypothetical protein D3P05_04320 [Paracoccus siganidrum]RMC30554.1 hypothetical protein C9E82_17750 [Paracoccus siganidrum]
MAPVNPAPFSTQAKFADEAALLAGLVAQAGLDGAARAAIAARAAGLVRRIRAETRSAIRVSGHKPMVICMNEAASTSAASRPR